MKKHLAGGFAAIVLSSMAGHAAADVLLDQLPTNARADNGSLSQFTGAPDLSFASAVIDDFNVTGPTTLTSVSAALEGFSNFSSFAPVTDYDVEIYTSVAAATSNLTGDVADVPVSSANVTISNPYGLAETLLVDIPVDISLGKGTYWIAVISDLNLVASGNSEIGVIGEGSGNSVQVNPGGGFGLVGNATDLNTAAGYEILDSIPEPAAWIEIMVGTALMGGLVRRRRAAAAAA